MGRVDEKSLYEYMAGLCFFARAISGIHMAGSLAHRFVR